MLHFRFITVYTYRICTISSLFTVLVDANISDSCILLCLSHITGKMLKRNYDCSVFPNAIIMYYTLALSCASLHISIIIPLLGHAAMEAAVCNLIERGDRVMSCVNGLWGERFAEMASRHGRLIIVILLLFSPSPSERNKTVITKV